MSIQSLLRSRPTKGEVEHSFKRNFWLRVHAFFLLTWCVGVGYACTKVLFMLGVESMGVRYALAVACSYFAFLVGVRVWLAYVGFEEYIDDDDIHETVSDVVYEMGDTVTYGPNMSAVRTPGFKGNGGTFDGGGSSGDWDGARSALSSSSSGADVSGGIDGDALPLIVIAAIVFVVFIILTGGIYLGAELLAQLAFEMLLVIHIRRGIKKGGLPWLSSAFKNTWWALILVMGITVGVGTWAEKTYDTHTAMDTVKAMVAAYKSD